MIACGTLKKFNFPANSAIFFVTLATFFGEEVVYPDDKVVNDGFWIIVILVRNSKVCHCSN